MRVKHVFEYCYAKCLLDCGFEADALKYFKSVEKRYPGFGDAREFIERLGGSNNKKRQPEEPRDSRVKEEASQERDDLYRDAVRMVLETGRGSVSMLQRHFEIGYTRAARLIDMMAEDGIVGEYKGSAAREVLISIEDWERGQGEERKAGRRNPGGKSQAKDPFDVLGISASADKDEIKQAYREKIVQCHPDKVATMAPEFRVLAENMAKELNWAYEECLDRCSGQA